MPTRETSKEIRHGSHSVTCNYPDACLYLVSVHQMVPPQTEVVNIQLQPTSHLSTPNGGKAESGWLADLQRTVSQISGHPSAAGRVQNRERSLVKDQRSTTVSRNRPNTR